LTKDRRQRLESAADGRLDIEEAQAPATPDLTKAAGQVTTSPRHTRWLRWLAVASGVGVALALTAMAVSYLREPRSQPPDLMRFQIPAPENATLARGGGFAVSPDGRHLAFAATAADGVSRLWLRALDSIEARPLPGTEGSGQTPPFWSPDSRSVAFNADGKLKRIDIAGGPAQTLCDAPLVLGGSWNQAGVILFTQYPGSIMRVSARGGVAVPVTKLDGSRQESTHGFPSFLPDGRHFVYLRHSGATSGTYVGSLDADSNEIGAKRVLDSPFETAYVPFPSSGHGQLLFRRDSTLLAQPFDDRALALVGEPVPLAEHLGSFLGIGFFSASASGVLVYRTGAEGQSSQLTWFNRQGRVLGTIGDPGFYPNIALSPDGARAAVHRYEFQTSAQDVWILDFVTDGSQRFTFGPRRASSPVWSPDGSHIVFASNRNGPFNLYQKHAHGATDEEALMTSPSGEEKISTSWSRDGRFLLYTETGPKTQADIWVLPLDGDRKPTPFLGTEFNEDQGQFSPDARWVAYRSDESGRGEVYARMFSPTSSAGKVLISRGGGSAPRWRNDGKELFYIASGGTLMGMSVTAGTEFRAGLTTPLFKMPIVTTDTYVWDVASDGTRFLVAVPLRQNAQSPFTVVANWSEELKAKVPTK
jgi:Tol biopolymer transport system component